MSEARTITEIAAAGAETAPAILAPGRSALDFGGLRRLMARTAADLRAFGIGRNDRVAIVLPNGPEMATAFLSIAAAATAAPLNPAYKADEFRFYLGDLEVKALVVERGSDSPAIAVAADLGIPALFLDGDAAAGAGTFRLGSVAAASASADGPARAEDIALILHTSGTTSRPKIVPLSHTNVCVSAGNIARTLKLTAADRGLNIMPLFHIHGLIAGLLAPLSVGGSVFCTPGFNALRFFAWMDEAAPTWFTAVPTMHQAILTRAAHNSAIIARHPLRFIRSSSSAMPPPVIAELERTFGAPVIEAYGMTEAAHQMASNSLDAPRRPGSV